MIVSFKDVITENIFNGIASKQAVKRLSNTLWKIAIRKFDQLDFVIIFDELKVSPENHLEKLSGDRNVNTVFLLTNNIESVLCRLAVV